MHEDKPSLASKGKPHLRLKGRIYMASITDVVHLQEPDLYRIQIFWQSDAGAVNNFIIRYINESTMLDWY
ncbi:hypothetical protein N7488_009845 [Penicillium malachiteum]|nr:hypothetical protein N7488_009845 [Penicillium malachiteum]